MNDLLLRAIILFYGFIVFYNKLRWLAILRCLPLILVVKQLCFLGVKIRRLWDHSRVERKSGNGLCGTNPKFEASEVRAWPAIELFAFVLKWLQTSLGFF